MDGPHQKLSVQPKLAFEDLQCLHPLYASTVRPETTPLAMRVRVRDPALLERGYHIIVNVSVIPIGN